MTIHRLQRVLQTDTPQLNEEKKSVHDMFQHARTAIKQYTLAHESNTNRPEKQSA